MTKKTHVAPLGLALALFLGSPAASFSDEDITYCSVLGAAASTAYAAYAANEPMSRQIELARNDRMLLAIVQLAYNRPLMYTEDQIVAEAMRFSNEVQAACFEGLSDAQ